MTAVDHLAGDPPGSLEAARSVEAVSAADVQADVKRADEAARAADEAEHAAIRGKVTAEHAVNMRGRAQFARKTAELTQRRHEHHLAAERIKSLHELGQAGLRHVAALQDLRTATAADLQTITELQQAIRDRFAARNQDLSELIGKIAALGPDKPLPGNVPVPSSAGVYAAVNTQTLIVGTHVLGPVDADHTDGPLAAIDASQRGTRLADPAVRLVRDGDVIVPMGRDPGGHIQRRIEQGQLHELTLAEKNDYYSGGDVA